MFRNFICFLAMLIAIPSFSQGVLKGTIRNSNGTILPGASVVVLKTAIGTTADTSGNFIITGIPTGSHKVSVSFVGFLGYEKNIVIRNGAATEITVELEPDIIFTSEVVVTATKSERTLSQVPGRIEIINSRTIESLPAIVIDDLLRAVPGIQVSRSYDIFSNKAIVTMRGLGGKEQSRVLVLVDGIPANKTDGGSVNWNLMNTAGIEKIEIAKGPASSLYGSNAMGGIIQIITKKPEKPISGKIALRGGSYGTMGGNLWLGGRINTAKKEKNKYLYWTINGFGNNSDGYFTEPSDSVRKADPSIAKTYLKEYGGGLRTGYVFNKNHSAEAEVNYYDDMRGSGVKVYEPTGGYTRHETIQARGRYRAQAGIFQINAHVFLQRENYHAMNESYKDYTYKLYDVSSVRNDVGLLFHITQKLFKNNTLTEGVDIKQGSVDAADVYYTSTDKVNNAGKMNFYAFYLQDEYSILQDKLSLVAGLRYDYSRYFQGLFTIENPTAATSFVMPFEDKDIAEESWQAISPKISIQYKPLKNVRTYISAASGFRPPILDDMCRSGKIRGGFKIANPKLKPETISNLEWGIDISLKEKLFIQTSIYYSFGKDFMYYVSTGDSVDLGYTPLTPVYMRKNISAVEIAGAEFGVTYKMNPHINLFANYAYNYAVIKNFIVVNPALDIDLSGKHLADVPKHLASAGFTWLNPYINATITGSYTGKMYINDKNEFDNTYLMSNQYPSYFVADFKLWKTLFKHLELSVEMKNIFNYIYHDSKDQVSPGRLVFGEISYKF